MTPEEFATKMQAIAGSPDIEANHGYADDLMCRVLESLGYSKGVQIYEKMDRWYA